MGIKRSLKDWAPQWVLRRVKGWLGKSMRFSGHYDSWSVAARESTGYDAAVILERVAASTRKVVAGEAHYERDSLLFHEPAYPFEILSVLLREAALQGGALEVLDFGGSLGSTYRQCRPFLEGVSRVRWRVIEQPEFARLGQFEFTTQELDFAEAVGVGHTSVGCGVVLLSSVLQYVEQPHRVLDNLILTGRRFVVIDRTPLSNATEDRLCIQHVPMSVYPASYPCWILSRQRLLDHFGEGWRALGAFHSAEGAYRTTDRLDFEFGGMIFEREG